MALLLWLALSLSWSGLAQAPLVMMTPVLLLGAVAAAFYRKRWLVWTPPTCLALSACLLVAWLVSGIHLRRWAPAVLFLEMAVLLWLALSPLSERRARA